MRFIITLITSLILLIPASGQDQWKTVELEFDSLLAFWGYGPGPLALPKNIVYVQFIDRDKGFISCCAPGLHGAMGVLYKTEDGGKTWNNIDEKFNPCIFSFHFLTESNGFALSLYTRGEGLLNSSDGGYSWSEDYTPRDNVSGVFFLNDSTAWVWKESNLFKTMNGGGDWDLDTRNGLGGQINSVFFIDDSTGWTVGSKSGNWIHKMDSDDGWERLSVPYAPLNKVIFVDRNIGWISGGYTSSDGVSPIFLRTVDGGETWTDSARLNYLINDFYFENKDHGWAVGEYGEWMEEKGVILETYNGGMDWDVVTDTLPARLSALNFYDGIGWAVGDSMLILTNDPTYTGIKEDNKIISGNEPILNYPNPFQATTIISYQLPATSNVELSVYDISGRKVTTLVNKRETADRYQVEWNAEGMESGIYFCELRTGQGRQVMKMSIVK